ncbi:winged helix-turn-helix transcriptional regulator [Lentzea tibetensis]|uniref:Winged helix-turn-helix transcriptional regulator n=1 Tax=Lentzea tibetensis TaxID=2591470 RepID=A0A563EY47_9PSEU|nr:MarR family winged helix-turn-helix transcriptional regulator [Lentzea tibetensis]TWP52472.1 winged helix-turn-helix transcriptional regulator [Lentzea tibetensis]
MEPPATCAKVAACVEKFDLNWLLHRAAQKLGSAFQDEALKHGVSMRGQLVLQALSSDEFQRTQLALGAALGLDKTTLTSELDKLERDGLVVRQPDPRDRRVRTPVITDQGRALTAKIALALAEVEAGFRSDLSEAEFGQLRELLSRLLNGDPVPGSCL